MEVKQVRVYTLTVTTFHKHTTKRVLNMWLTLSRCLKLLSKVCWAFLASERCWGEKRMEVTHSAMLAEPLPLSLSPLPHPFALLFQILQVFGEFHADARHHVFGHELSLAGVIVEFVQDLLKRRVVAESADNGGINLLLIHPQLICGASEPMSVSKEDLPVSVLSPFWYVSTTEWRATAVHGVQTSRVSPLDYRLFRNVDLSDLILP